jgi:hypothetical protein
MEKLILDVLPIGLGVFVVVASAGLLGVFRSVALSKQAYNETVESLKTQIDVIKQENALLKLRIAELEK